MRSLLLIAFWLLGCCRKRCHPSSSQTGWLSPLNFLYKESFYDFRNRHGKTAGPSGILTLTWWRPVRHQSKWWDNKADSFSYCRLTRWPSQTLAMKDEVNVAQGSHSKRFGHWMKISYFLFMCVKAGRHSNFGWFMLVNSNCFCQLGDTAQQPSNC